MIETIAFIALYIAGINGALLASYGLVRLWYWLWGWTWTDTWD